MRPKSHSEGLRPITVGSTVTYRKIGTRTKYQAACFAIVDGVAHLLGGNGYLVLHPAIYKVLDVRPWREG
jgi:hypothetical protein